MPFMDDLDRILMARANLRQVYEFLLELKGEWEWKKNEPRDGNQRDYNALVAMITFLKFKLDEDD